MTLRCDEHDVRLVDVAQELGCFDWRCVVCEGMRADRLAEGLNRRVEVEQELLDCARGKLPPPTPEKLRQWALRLGVPEDWRSPRTTP